MGRIVAVFIIPSGYGDGWRNPVTVSRRSGLIVRGHGRLEAALLIGCETMLDDDISACVCMVSLRCRKLSIPETIAMLENSAWCARGAGARLFGWHQRSDPRLLQRNDPFGVNHWVGGAVGVVRDEKGGVPKWDELLKCKCDIDATLQELMDNRLVWNEARFCFVQERDKNLGGNSLYRSEERIATEKRHLKRKWKSHIRLETYKSQDRTAMDVPRRQSVKL
jgi:hypothetical protein